MTGQKNCVSGATNDSADKSSNNSFRFKLARVKTLPCHHVMVVYVFDVSNDGRNFFFGVHIHLCIMLSNRYTFSIKKRMQRADDFREPRTTDDRVATLATQLVSSIRFWLVRIKLTSFSGR